MIFHGRQWSYRELNDRVNALALGLTRLRLKPGDRVVREYRRSHSGMGLGDYLIAATALTEGLELATLNVRHYLMLPGLARPF